MTLSDVKRAAAKVGATVEYEKSGRCNVLRVEAPKGSHWASGVVHEFVDEAYIPWKPDFHDMLERMGCGIEPCDDTCEYWGAAQPAKGE